MIFDMFFYEKHCWASSTKMNGQVIWKLMDDVNVNWWLSQEVGDIYIKWMSSTTSRRPRLEVRDTLRSRQILLRRKLLLLGGRWLVLRLRWKCWEVCNLLRNRQLLGDFYWQLLSLSFLAFCDVWAPRTLFLLW